MLNRRESEDRFWTFVFCIFAGPLLGYVYGMLIFLFPTFAPLWGFVVGTLFVLAFCLPPRKMHILAVGLPIVLVSFATVFRMAFSIETSLTIKEATLDGIALYGRSFTLTVIIVGLFALWRQSEKWLYTDSRTGEEIPFPRRNKKP